MKFIAFNVRDDERQYFETWIKENQIEVDVYTDEITPDNLDLVKGYDAVIALQPNEYPKEFFSKFAEFGGKVFSIRNVGVDNIDLEAAAQNNIPVTNVPAYSPNAIAEFSVTLLLQLLRNTEIFEKRMQANDYRWAPYVGKEIHDLTVGILGTGRIGQAAIQIYKGFGAKIVAFDPYHNPELEKEDIYVDSKEELYAKADVISLHMPATKQDEHMIDQDAIALMKDGVYIINTARGSLIDTKALLAALKSGKIAGAGLDTYEYENPIFNHDLRGQKIEDELFNELVSLDNVLVTPHVAFYTQTAVKNMVTVALDSAKSVIETGSAATLVKK